MIVYVRVCLFMYVNGCACLRVVAYVGVCWCIVVYLRVCLCT